MHVVLFLCIILFCYRYVRRCWYLFQPQGWNTKRTGESGIYEKLAGRQ